MKSLIFAVRFLTVLPLGFKYNKDKNSTIFFPVAGLLLGIILAIANSLLADIIPEFLLNVILVVLLVILTGGLHLDGLADTIDGFYAGKDRDDVLRIMRDSHIGSMGVIGLICVVLLKIGFLQAVSSSVKFKALLIMPVLSRWSMVFALFLFDYAREQGKAKDFFTGLTWKKFFLSTLVAVIITYFVFEFKGLLLIFFVAFSTFIFGKGIKIKISGLTGDTLGAINEVNEVLILLFLCVVGEIIV